MEEVIYIDGGDRLSDHSGTYEDDSYKVSMEYNVHFTKD